MPNWCHNTLTVTGEPEDLERFIEAVRPQDDVLRQEYDERWVVPEYIAPEHRERYLEDLGPKPEFEVFAQEARERQPLSFESLCPTPPNDELRKLERYQPCTMCGAHGTLPESELQAVERGARWYPWMDPTERENRTCNVCGGSKQERVGMEGWYTWRLSNWGTKWDAAFANTSGLFAIGSEDMDVDVAKESQVATITPTVAVYKFDTAWSPPSPLVERASDDFPELEFTLRFGEVGGDFAGEERYVGGLLIGSEDLEVTDVLAPEEMWC